jgi:Major Facilitator Superfamily
MMLTGVALPNLQHIIFILGIAFFGTINPTIGDIGVHIPLEQAVLAGGTSDSERTSIFARYSLVGGLSIAAGSLVAGLPDALVSFGMAKGGALRIMFYVYAALGLVGAVFYSFLPRTEVTRAPSKSTALGPSRKTIYKLAALFRLDAFASGFVVQSIMALWLFERFQLSLAAASAFFFCSNILAAFSYLVAARLGKHFGLINTMVFTHIPASICLILVAFCWNLTVAIILLLVRAALSQMDVPTRTSYVMGVVTPAERTVAASFTAVPRRALAGAMLATSFTGLPLVVSGILKTIYDLTLLCSFRHLKPPEEMDNANNMKCLGDHAQHESQE